MRQLPSIALDLAARTSQDVARNLERDLIEHSLQRLVATFQRFAEATFAGLPPGHGINPRRNVFQNLNESSALWEQAIGQRYDQMLDTSDINSLHQLFQQRHLLAHREGLVDQDYIDRSGDLTYGIGQRVVVRPEQILELARLVEQLASQLSTHAQRP